MRKQITSHAMLGDYANQIPSLNLEFEFPKTCPHCNYGIEARHIASFHINEGQNGLVHSVFYCPHCTDTFFTSGITRSEKLISVRRIYPYPEAKTKFSSNVEDISLDFCAFYEQSEAAENSGLTGICGMGYRKALEFLVKDYAISLNSSDSTLIEKIKKMSLSNCINDYVNNNRIKKLALASSWIGNDETHYVRKHEDYDISSLKSFIQALVTFIDSDYQVAEAEKLLGNPKN